MLLWGHSARKCEKRSLLPVGAFARVGVHDRWGARGRVRKLSSRLSASSRGCDAVVSWSTSSDAPRPEARHVCSPSSSDRRVSSSQPPGRTRFRNIDKHAARMKLHARQPHRPRTTTRIRSYTLNLRSLTHLGKTQHLGRCQERRVRRATGILERMLAPARLGYEWASEVEGSCAGTELASLASASAPVPEVRVLGRRSIARPPGLRLSPR